MPGLSQRIRALVLEQAARGYLVVASSLFGRGRAGQDHGYKYQMAFSGEQLVKPCSLWIQAAPCWTFRPWSFGPKGRWLRAEWGSWVFVGAACSPGKPRAPCHKFSQLLRFMAGE